MVGERPRDRSFVCQRPEGCRSEARCGSQRGIAWHWSGMGFTGEFGVLAVVRIQWNAPERDGRTKARPNFMASPSLPEISLGCLIMTIGMIGPQSASAATPVAVCATPDRGEV